MRLSFCEIKEAITECLSRAGLSVPVFPVVPGPIYTEGLYCEIHGSTYVYAYTERGTHTVRCETQDINEFFYAILRDIVREQAVDYELTHRIPGRDSRRIWMPKAVEWMEKIDPEYGKRLAEEFAEILQRAPLKDILLCQWELQREAHRLWRAMTDKKWRFPLSYVKPLTDAPRKKGVWYYLYTETTEEAGAYVFSRFVQEEEILCKSADFQKIQAELALTMAAQLVSENICKRPIKYRKGVSKEEHMRAELELLQKCNTSVYELAQRRMEERR